MNNIWRSIVLITTIALIIVGSTFVWAKNTVIMPSDVAHEMLLDTGPVSKKHSGLLILYQSTLKLLNIFKL